MKPFLFALLFACGLCRADALLPDAYTFSSVGGQESGVQLHFVVVGSFTINAPGDLIITPIDLTSFNMTLVETTGPMFGSTQETFQLGFDDINDFELDIPDNTLTMSVQIFHDPTIAPSFAAFRVFPNFDEIALPGDGPLLGSVGFGFGPFILTPVLAPEPTTLGLLCLGLVGFTALRRRFEGLRSVHNEE